MLKYALFWIYILIILDLSKKDPEGRNIVALCLLYASIDVLRAVHKMFTPHCDMGEFILK